MARPVAKPPFPDTPGAWLANYRYRLRGESGQPPSPEQLASRLSVSGSTVRRWEAGTARPSPPDLLRFAEVCCLAPLETEFLLRAFSGQPHEAAPAESAFRAAAGELLNTEFPAYILDSFFFVRAWNNYVAALFAAPSDPQVHVIAAMLRIMAEGSATPDREKRLRRRLRDFWLSTATLCGTQAYRRVLSDLCAEPGFELYWRLLAQEPSDLLGEVVRAPYTIRTERFGAFRVFPARLVLPPVYELREYVPLDEQARQRLEAFHSTRSPAVTFSPYVHWTIDPRLSEVE